MVPPPLLLLPLLLQRRLTLGVSDVRSIGSETGRFLDMLRYAAARLAAGEAARWLHAASRRRARAHNLEFLN